MKRKAWIGTVLLLLALSLSFSVLIVLLDGLDSDTFTIRLMDAASCTPLPDAEVTRYLFSDLDVPFLGITKIGRATVKTDANGDAVFNKKYSRGSLTEVKCKGFPKHGNKPMGFIEDPRISHYIWLSK
jgi:hypothetical protein